MDEDIINKTVTCRLKEEIKSGIQTIQYQLITLMTCNGQAPFVTMFMYLDEVPEGQTRDDLALIIDEVLRQRMQGVKMKRAYGLHRRSPSSFTFWMKITSMKIRRTGT